MQGRNLKILQLNIWTFASLPFTKRGDKYNYVSCHNWHVKKNMFLGNTAISEYYIASLPFIKEGNSVLVDVTMLISMIRSWPITITYIIFWFGWVIIWCRRSVSMGIKFDLALWIWLCNQHNNSVTSLCETYISQFRLWIMCCLVYVWNLSVALARAPY